jgi:hypothetical protein
MKIAYILSTCEQYVGTRLNYQMESFLKYVDINNVYYLSSKMDNDKRVYGWNTFDDPNNITYKYINFFKNITLDYDWYFFGNDDTYVFHKRLVALLKTFNSTKHLYIGRILDHVQSDLCAYMSGGAGYVISKPLYKLILDYVRKNTTEFLFKHWCDDLCIGLWIVELNKTNKVDTINDSRFHLEQHIHLNEMPYAITCSGICEREKFSEYDNYLKYQDTTIVLVTDAPYWYKTLVTLDDIRNTGKWLGLIQVISVDFTIPPNDYDVKEIKFSKIDTSRLVQKIGAGFSGWDGRELSKLHQWEKLHVFDEHFKQWKRVIFIDAGLRVLDSIDYLLELDYKGKFLSPNDQGDGPIKNNNTFSCQISHDNLELVERLTNDFGDIMNSSYFLNCIWIYDTEILNHINKQEFIDIMNNYPLLKTNEMGVMNIILTFKMKLWKPFPYKASNGKYLFDWSDYNKPGSKCNEYCFMKYPSIGLSKFIPDSI